MRRFIFKTLFFIVLLIVLNVQTKRILPFGWENTEYFAKMEHFRKTYQAGTNTLFFGSSRTLRHIDPVVFDSLNALRGIYTHSYNMASSAVFFNEQFYLFDYFFHDSSSTQDLEYLFLELDDLVIMADIFIGTTRGAYYVNASNLEKISTQIVLSPIPLNEKIAQIYYHLAGMIANDCHIGLGGEMLKHLLSRPRPPMPRPAARMGYTPIDTIFYEFRHTKNWQERRQELEKDTQIVHRLFERRASLYRHPVLTDLYNPLVLATYQDFIAAMQQRGVHVICILPMRGVVEPALISLYQALPDQHKINMTAHPDIEKLKAVKFWFDTGHLSLYGSRIYTELTSDAFIHFLQNME
ncbi:MAG TPA: hypothetical protein VI603_01345 [Saprospiraceae bacterium]|nr:hypothetical protein [Saprospiraceae bacterium]